MNPTLWLSLCPLALLLVAIAIAGRLRKWRWARMAAEDKSAHRITNHRL